MLRAVLSLLAACHLASGFVATGVSRVPLRPIAVASAPLRPQASPRAVHMVGNSYLDALERKRKHVPLLKKLQGYPKSIYKFSRPHTIRGTILASITGVIRAIVENPGALQDLQALLPRAVLGLVALLLGNAYIVGINQIYDVKIDEINKPFLPMAAGEMSRRLAWGVVGFAAIVGPLIVKQCFSPLILGLYLFGLLIGTLYSVPPFQTKRFPVIAGLTIACVRGFLLNFGVYYATREALGLPFRWNRRVVFLARFMTVFAGVIAVTKDLPDVEGDKRFNIRTLASRVGIEKVAKGASVVLALNYLSAIAEGALAPAGAFNRPAMLGGHLLLLGYLARSFSKLRAQSKASIKEFYARVWDLFYLEYVLCIL